MPHLDDTADNGMHVISGAFTEPFDYLDMTGSRDLLIQPDRYCAVSSRTASSTRAALRPCFWAPGDRCPPTFRHVERLPADGGATPSGARTRSTTSPPSSGWTMPTPRIPRDVDRLPLIIGASTRSPELASARAFHDLLAIMVTRRREKLRRTARMLYSSVDFNSLFVTGAERSSPTTAARSGDKSTVRKIVIDDGRSPGSGFTNGERSHRDAVVCARYAGSIEGLLPPSTNGSTRSNSVPALIVCAYLGDKS